MDEMMLRQGQKVFDTICGMLDDIGYHYQKHEDDLAITCTVHGEDIPMDILMIVRPEKQIVTLLSRMPFTAPEDKRIELGIAVNIANNGLIDGNFDYDMADGRITFRLTASFIESILGKKLFEYMLMVSASTVDHYNDKFLMLCKGMINLEQFIDSEK